MPNNTMEQDYIGYQILLVDDNHAIVTVMELLLLEKGFQVATANNGRQAVSWLSRQKFDMVITDLEMPEMDGYELMGLVISQYTGTKVIAMSANGATAAQLQRQGAAAFFHKPFEMNDLLKEINRLVSEKRRAPRFQAVPGITCRVRNKYTALPGVVRNISVDGALVELYGDIGYGSDIQLDILLQEGQAGYGNISGRIIRRHTNQCSTRLAVCFDKGRKRRLLDHLEPYLSMQPVPVV